MTADIERMYRIIKRSPMGQSTKPNRIFLPTTVTYRTSSAPYSATRCLRKLTEDEKVKFPVAAETIIYEFYVDDMLKSVDSVVGSAV